MVIDMRHIWIGAIATLLIVSLDPSLFASPSTQEFALKGGALVSIIGLLYQFRTWSIGRYASHE